MRHNHKNDNKTAEQLNTPTIADEWISCLPHQNPSTIDGYRNIISSQHHRFLYPLVKPGARILEAGCGYGKNVLAFAACGAFGIGLDFVHEFTKSTLQHATDFNISNVSVTTGTILNLPFQENTFDLYTSFGVYEHFRSSQKQLICLEAYRTLKPGGYVFIQVPHLWSLWSLRRQIRYWYRAFIPPRLVWQRNISRKAIIRDFESCGFQTIDTHVYESWLSFSSGLSLYTKTVKGIPNPFYFLRGCFQRLSLYLDTREIFGFTLVYIGKKPED